MTEDPAGVSKGAEPPLRKTKNDKEEFDAERHKAYY